MDKTQWGKTTEDLAISISVAKPLYRSSDAIVLNIALKNFGKTPIPIVVRSPWIDYALAVRYEGRTDIPKTAYALQRIDAGAEGRRMTRDLMPEEVLTESVELSKGYDMVRPGAYTVVATREVYQRGRLDQYATVTSNELTIQIAQEEDDK